jgi:hypothetical protein
MNEMREVKDLAVGDVIQVEGFDDNMTVRAAKKIKKGVDAGELEVTLVAPDGEKEVMGFDPEERVKVVGKDSDAGKGNAKAKAAAEPGAGKQKKARRQKKAKGEKKMSAIDAAAKLLTETGQAMNCQQLIQTMAEKGLWSSPGGKTPAATLYSSILRELQTKGKDARFKKTERGMFAASGRG